MAGIEFVDRRRVAGPHRRAARRRSDQPGNQQAITCCFAVEYLDGEDHTIDRPAEYAFWRDYVPALKPPGRDACST